MPYPSIYQHINSKSVLEASRAKVALSLHCMAFLNVLIDMIASSAQLDIEMPSLQYISSSTVLNLCTMATKFRIMKILLSFHENFHRRK